MNLSLQGLPVHHNSRSSLRLMSIESVMPSSHLILCRPLLLLPSIPPSIRVFSNESTLRMRWPKCWSFSFSIIPSKEIPELISFRMDWLDFLAVQGTLILINNYLKCKWVECPNRRQRLAEWIQKHDPYICCLQETHLKPRDTYRLKVKVWKKIFRANRD